LELHLNMVLVITWWMLRLLFGGTFLILFCEYVYFTFSGFPRLLERPGIFIGKFPGPGKSRKMTLDLESPWIYLQGPGKSWNLLGNDIHGSFWFQLDMFMQTKIAMIVSIRYVFWAAGMSKMLSRPGFLPGPRCQSLQCSPRLLSCCLLLYLDIAGLRRGAGKMLLEPGKSWKSPGTFCIQESRNPAFCIYVFNMSSLVSYSIVLVWFCAALLTRRIYSSWLHHQGRNFTLKSGGDRGRGHMASTWSASL